MPTEVQLKDGTRLRLKGDNLTPEQVAEKVSVFRAQRQDPAGKRELRLVQPEPGQGVNRAYQRLNQAGQPREVIPAPIPAPAQTEAPPVELQDTDPNVFLGRRSGEIERLRQQGGEVTAGPVSSSVRTEQAQQVPKVLQKHLRLPEQLVGPAAEQAITLGLSDEAAGLASLATGGSFSEGAQAERERIKGDVLTQGPGQRVATQALGAVSAGGPTKELLTRIPGLLGSAALAGKTGAIFGGIEGGARAEGGLVERGVGAGRGAVTGAAVGVTTGLGIPALFNGVSKGVRTIGNKVTVNVDRMTARERRALKEIMQAFSEDGIAVPEARRRLAEWAAQGGEPAALFDLGGPAVERLARSLGGRINRASSRLQNEVDQRISTQADEIADNLSRTVSRETNYAQAVDDLNTHRQTMAAPLYEQAYGQKVKVTPAMQRLLKRDAVRRAVPNARRIASNEDIDLAELGLVQNADGSFAFADEVDIQLIDYLKRGIDRDLNRRFRDSTTGRLNIDDESRGIVGTKRALLEQADKQVPVYKDARDVWSGTAETLDALALGKDIFKPSVTADILSKRVKGMSQGDEEYLRAGVVRAITDKVENATDGANLVRKFFNRPAFRKKLRLIFDDRVQLENFEALMRRQLDKIDRTQRIAPRFNSQTQQRGGDIAQRTVEGFDVGTPIRSTLRAGGRAVMRSVRDKRATAQQDEQDETVFELLFDKDNPLSALERGQRFAPELAAQRTGAALSRPGTVALERAVDDALTPPEQ